MHRCGASKEEVLRPDFDRSIMMDFQGARLSSDTGFILMRELDQRHNVIGPIAETLEDNRSSSHTKHAFEQMIRQRVYQMAAAGGCMWRLRSHLPTTTGRCWVRAKRRCPLDEGYEKGLLCSKSRQPRFSLGFSDKSPCLVNNEAFGYGPTA